MSTGEKIKALRKEKKWSQDDLSKAIAIHSKHISRYENNKATPSPDTLKKNGKSYQPIGNNMEKIINIHIEKLPEGVYLATSEDIQGLVAQGRTVTEALEIARDVARKLIEARRERQGGPKLPEVKDSFDYPLIVST